MREEDRQRKRFFCHATGGHRGAAYAARTPSGLILPILRACARTGVKIRVPRRHLGQWWNVLHWNTLHRFPHMHACGTSQEIRRLTRITPHLTRAIQPRNLRQRRTAPNTPPRANTVHLSRVRADRSQNSGKPCAQFIEPDTPPQVKPVSPSRVRADWANNSRIHSRDAPTRTARRRPFAGAPPFCYPTRPGPLNPVHFSHVRASHACARNMHFSCAFMRFLHSTSAAKILAIPSLATEMIYVFSFSTSPNVGKISLMCTCKKRGGTRGHEKT